jgi:DNA-binding MarR family transcriptional regulator
LKRVERRVDERHRRRTRIHASAAVIEYLEHTASPWIELLDGALARGGESERRDVVESLGTLQRLLEEEAAAQDAASGTAD